MTHCDVAILGSGPAGLALARALASRGARVACISPSIDEEWGQNYGAWEHEIPEEFRAVIEDSWVAPSVWTGSEEHMLSGRYCRLNTSGLQTMLKSDCDEHGMQSFASTAVRVDHDDDGSCVVMSDGREVRCKTVVDCTGARSRFVERESTDEVAYQTAFGQMLEVDSHPFFMGEMVFMDFRPLPGDRPETPPTFLYAMPLSARKIFVEETSLVSQPAVPMAVLRSRLQRRLGHLRIRGWRTVEEERCQFPMNLALPGRKQRTLAYGLAASMVHPATGYQVARSLGRADAVAKAIVDGLDDADRQAASVRAWRAIWSKDDLLKWELFSFGSRFLANLNADQTRQFFTTFFSLPAEDWKGFLSGTTGTAHVASVMTKVFAGVDPMLRWELMRRGASLNGLSLLKAAVAR